MVIYPTDLEYYDFYTGEKKNFTSQDWQYRPGTEAQQRWETSDELLNRQTNITTYSTEITIIYEIIRQFVMRLMRLPVLTNDQLNFIIRCDLLPGPIGNAVYQVFPIQILSPIQFNICIIKTLNDEGLFWSISYNKNGNENISINIGTTMFVKKIAVNVTETVELDPELDHYRKRKIRI